METEKRLIDANALVEVISKHGCLNALVRFINNVPTVDAVEVVHGKWLAMQVEGGDPFDGNSTYCFDVFQCSECGAHFDVSEAMTTAPTAAQRWRMKINDI